MSASCLEHPTEDILERYLLSRASAEEFNFVETHLFACERCLDRVDQIQDFRTSLRDGFTLLKQEAKQRTQAEVPPLRSQSARGRRLFTWIAGISIPRWTLVPAMAALILGVFLLPNLRGPNGRDPDSTAFNVALSAMRGDEPAPVIPAGRQVEFYLNLQGLTATAVSAQFVDSVGRPVGPSQTFTAAEHLTLTHPAFESGSYFLRIFPAKNGNPDQSALLREFPFQAR